MLTIKDVVIIILVAIALYIYGRYCYNNGFEDALGAKITGIYKVGSDNDGKEDVTLPKKQVGKCDTCLFKVMDEETGYFLCGNHESQAFSKTISNNDTCDHFCKEWEREENENDD